MAKEATARIKINRMLEASGWRFFDTPEGRANIQLEPNVKITQQQIDELGNDFEKRSNGFIDFLLLDDNGFPFAVLEAKAERLHPLSAKEQARKYARQLKCRFIILSNGDQHYLWDLERGNPNAVTAFPTPTSLGAYQKASAPDSGKIVEETVSSDYVVSTQFPKYDEQAGWKNEQERPRFIEENSLRFLREYQTGAVHAIQAAVKNGKDRFLLEMATGTGKTLTSAAIIKLFLRTGNAKRVLFLVDRLELEDQAYRAFSKLLRNDFKAVIYKENKGDWRHAEIVVTTVQSLLFNNKYQQLFCPTDFDLVISDEAHRSIGGNARAVFDYFIGYKLGLTATPKDYLKNFSLARGNPNDPREVEKRLLRDTYRTFGCDDGQPTFRYSLLDGVRDGYLINPTVVDARSNITTQLLSEQGFTATYKDEQGEDHSAVFSGRDFEKKFFAEGSNELFCKVFLEHALRDPVSGEFGKSIIFTVSQQHAAKVTQILNVMADRMYPGRYNSDFAIQVTSHITEAQQFTINFANNNLSGTSTFLPGYKTCKTRVCVTVGMMTTGYDCPDILNLGLFRPIFSPTDFIQIKGRGTRKHDFRTELHDEQLKQYVTSPNKTSFKLFDFFANCEFFEEHFDYDETLTLPSSGSGEEGPGKSEKNKKPLTYTHGGEDIISSITTEDVGAHGMKIDRRLYDAFAENIKRDSHIVGCVEAGKWDEVISYLNNHVFPETDGRFSLEKLRQATGSDRRVSLREILELIFGLIPRLKSKDELLEEEFSKFVADHKPEEPDVIPALRSFFKAYATSNHLRSIIESGELVALATNPSFSTADYKKVPVKYRQIIPEYIRDYVPVHQFAA